MTIEFRCIHCGRLLRVPDETAGAQAECPNCGQVQTVAAASPDQAGPPPEPPPQFAPAPPIPDAWHRDATDRVQAPAVCLILVGVLGAAGQIARLLGGAIHVGFAPFAGHHAIEHMFSGSLGIGFSGIFLALSALVLYGGWMMMHLERYSWAKAAAIVALIPCISPCCCLGIPAGIWALVVLAEPTVKAAFRS